LILCISYPQITRLELQLRTGDPAWLSLLARFVLQNIRVEVPHRLLKRHVLHAKKLT